MSQITYSDISIRPQYSEVKSRGDVDLTTDMGNFKLEVPIISANMRHITGPKMASAMHFLGGMGILHRFNTTEEAIWEFKETYRLIEDSLIFPPENIVSLKPVGVSIGVKDSDKERFDELYNVGARIFCIDVNHGHHVFVKNMLKWIKEKNQEVTLIAGNIATKEASEDLQEWGADILKVGIGPGNVCMTRRNTGVGVPQFTALDEVSSVAQIPTIADGGIQYSGDVTKALIKSDCVMVGSVLAGSIETPGKVFCNEYDEFYKVYGGSAAGENKVANGGKSQFVEGVMKTVPFKGHVKYIVRRIKEGLQSGFSLSGALTLKEFQTKVKWDIISSGGRNESKI